MWISHHDTSLDLLVVLREEKQQQGRWLGRSVKQQMRVGETQRCWLPL
jgi:hypothetical protein